MLEAAITTICMCEWWIAQHLASVHEVLGPNICYGEAKLFHHRCGVLRFLLIGVVLWCFYVFLHL